MSRFFKQGSNTSRKYPFWIIVDRVKESVWVGDRESCIFNSESEATTEFNFQNSAMKSGMKTNYKIERIDEPGGLVALRESIKKTEVDELEEMARQASGFREPFAN